MTNKRFPLFTKEVTLKMPCLCQLGYYLSRKCLTHCRIYISRRVLRSFVLARISWSRSHFCCCSSCAWASSWSRCSWICFPGFHDLLSSGCDFLPFRQHTEAAGGAVLALDIGFQGLRDLLLGAHLSCPAMEPEEAPVHTVWLLGCGGDPIHIWGV